MKSEQTNQKKGEEREGGGLPRRCAALQSRRSAGKRKAGSGHSLPEQATMAPRSGHSTAARSPAGERARRRGGRQRRQGSTDSPLESLGAALAALRKESGEDREWRRPNGARVQGRRCGRRFCSCDARGWPSDRRERLRSIGPTRGPGGRADVRALPAQA